MLRSVITYVLATGSPDRAGRPCGCPQRASSRINTAGPAVGIFATRPSPSELDHAHSHPQMDPHAYLKPRPLGSVLPTGGAHVHIAILAGHCYIRILRDTR